AQRREYRRACPESPRESRRASQYAAMQRLLAAIGVACVVLVLPGMGMVESAQPAHFDVLIHNARVMDGMGNPWLRADLGITGDRVASGVRLTGATAARRIDAHDRLVSPGFIDVRSHAADGIKTRALRQAQ